MGFVCLEWRRIGVQSILGDGTTFVMGGTDPEVGTTGSARRIGWSHSCDLVGFIFRGCMMVDVVLIHVMDV